MTFEDLQHSLTGDHPPADLSPELRALWHDARGAWDQAHQAVQDLETAEAAWVHAYLHRKEGDIGNARYWYARARRPECTAALDAEWQQIARALLGS